MMWLIVFFFIPAHSHLFTPRNNSSNPCTDHNHLFLVPGALTSGGTSRACLSRFFPDGPARVEVSLVTEDGYSTTATRDLAAGDGGCLDISVPQRPNTKAELYVSVRYPEASCTWQQHLSARISSGTVLVLQTERGRYRPGDTVRFRAVAVRADLTPAHTVIDEIWLERPGGAWDGVRIAQWLRVRTRLGLAQAQHELDEMAPPGKWTLRARLEDGSQGTASFLVGNYELPPFQLTVRHAAKVLRTSDKLAWTVCVRYPWSEAVEGMLVIRIRASGRGPSAGGIRTVVRLRAPRACHRHAAAAARVGLLPSVKGVAPDVIVADFSFQEEGTRVWQNTTVVSQIVDNPITLEFLTKHRPVISPGLPYKLKIKATRYDDKPAPGENIEICRSPALTIDSEFHVANASCVNSTTDDKGMARVMFTAEVHGSPFYVFQARSRNSSARLVAGSSLEAAHAALGPLRAAHTRALLPLYLRLPSPITTLTPLTVHFVVITRGGIIYRWGATTQCPITSTTDQIYTAPRNSICPNTLARLGLQMDALNANSTDAIDSLLDRHVSKVMLPIKVTHQMCPDSYLFAYFYYNDVLVTASKHFEMEECFANKVDATWTTRLTAPGSVASLQIKTPGPALCALTALDTAAGWAQPRASVKDLLMLELRRLVDRQRNLTEYDAAGDCFLTSDEPIWAEGAELARSGVCSIGALSKPTCPSGAPQLLQARSEDQVRSDFTEAWLWRLLAVGANGSAVASARAPDSITRFEASVFCLAKNGVAVSQPAVLQVFREFFIHADSPHSLKRGDAAIVRYRLFNYLYEPISVQVDVSADGPLEVAQALERVCVGARASVSRRTSVRALAHAPSPAHVRVRAGPGRTPTCNATATPAVSDEVVIQIQVDPEGIPVNEFKSAMLCADSVRGSPKDTWKWPAVQAVPGTESLTVWVTGDVNGPLYAEADALVLLPRGCGEQNMARLAANLLALRLLAPSSAAASVAKLHLARGFTRQLQYVHPSGGFSAFGAPDASASTWLTAFCVRYLRRVYEELSPSSPVPAAIQRAELWLLDQQMENGCFRNEGQVFHRELRGGLNEEGETASVALTAYVITSLIQSASPLPFRVIRNSLSCLRALPLPKTKTSKVYAHTLLAYSFVRLRRYEEELKKTNEVSLVDGRNIVAGLAEDEETTELLELMKMARRNGRYVWWETGNLATSVEATGYALLALALCPRAMAGACAADAGAAVRWLSTHRSGAGGFISTQDTLVASEGISRWTSLQPPASNLTVTLRSGPDVNTIKLTPGVKIPDIVKMGASEELGVVVEGKGCALVQATRAYNTLALVESADKSLVLYVAVTTDGAFGCDDSAACFCAAVVEVCALWRDRFPEMALLELTLPAGFGADAKLLYDLLHASNTLLRRIELSPNNGKVSLYLGSRDGSDTIPRAGHECFPVHAVGPHARTKPAFARILDYYRPHVTDTQIYSIPEECPSRISHETNKYLASDNLFNKAKSLTDSAEIVITHDFSFEDIPEGIPLEDPIYDNLTKINKTIEANLKTNTENVEEDTLIAVEMIDSDKNVHTTNNSESSLNSHQEIHNEKELDNEIPVSNIKGESLGDVNEKIYELTSKTNDKMTILSSKTDTNMNYKDGMHMEALILQDNDSVIRENPALSSFHVIDTDKDLEVPHGIEGPVPSIVLPPPNFIPPKLDTPRYWMRPVSSRPQYYQPFYYNLNYRDRRRRIS